MCSYVIVDAVDGPGQRGGRVRVIVRVLAASAQLSKALDGEIDKTICNRHHHRVVRCLCGFTADCDS